MKETAALPFILHFRMSSAEYSRFIHQLALMFYRRRRPRSKALNLFVWLGIWVLLALAFIIVSNYAQRLGNPNSLLLYLILVAFFAGGLFVQWFMLWSQRQVIAGMVRGLPAVLDTEASIDETTLRWRTGPYSFSSPLVAISQILEFEGGLLVRAGLNGVFLPVHAFTGEEQKAAILKYLLGKLSPEAVLISMNAA